MALQSWWLRSWLLGLVLGVLLLSAPCAEPGRAECTAGGTSRKGSGAPARPPGPLRHATSFQCAPLLPGSSILGEPPPPQPSLCRRSFAFSLLRWVKGRVGKDVSILGTFGPSGLTRPSLGLLPHPPLVPEAVSLSLSWCLWSPPCVPGPRPRSESQAALSLGARAESLCPTLSPAPGAGAGCLPQHAAAPGPSLLVLWPVWLGEVHQGAAFLPCVPWGGLKAGCAPLQLPKPLQ